MWWLADQWNAILMSFLLAGWLRFIMEYWLGSFVIFPGIWTRIDNEHYSFVIFQGGGWGRTPCPPSGSTHVYCFFLAVKEDKWGELLSSTKTWGSRSFNYHWQMARNERQTSYGTSKRNCHRCFPTVFNSPLPQDDIWSSIDLDFICCTRDHNVTKQCS